MDCCFSDFIKSQKERFHEFFFRREIPYGIALIRIILPAILLFVMGQRWRYVREFYSSEGAPAPIAMNYGWNDFLPLLSGNAAVVLFTVMLLFLVTLMIGWKSRLSALGACLLYTYFTMQDSLGSLTKYSVISTHILLLLSLSECGAVWSVDRLLELKRNGVKNPLNLLGTGRAVEIWPQRLLQFCLAFIYFGAAITKLQTPAYFSGDQMRFWLLTELNHWNPVGEILSLQPALLVPMMYLALLWEGTFLLLVWKKNLRLFYLAIGVLFHLSTTLMLGLMAFPSICLTLYFCFLTQADVEWCREKMARFLYRNPWLYKLTKFPARFVSLFSEPVVRLGNRGIACCLFVLTLVGVFSEQLVGVYAGHASEKYVLQTMEPAEVRKLLRGDSNIREQDKLLSFDIGKLLIGGVVVESIGNRFQIGSQLYLQANLIPPHGDLVLECCLASEQGYLIDQFQGIARRESLRYTFTYRVSESCEPGNYFLLLKCNNQEIARKSIQIVSR